MVREHELEQAAVKQADKWYGNTPGELSKNIFKRGVEWGAQWEADRARAVPYQCCPICNGLGKILAPNCISSMYVNCDVCNGAKIIPMFQLPPPAPKTQ